MKAKRQARARGFGLALSYVLGMALVYTAAGMAAAAAGAQLQAMFNQPWVLMIFAAFFILLAAAMFGGYDLQMPSGIQSKLAGISGNQKGGTTIGAFIMGALSALIVTACVAPALNRDADRHGADRRHGAWRRGVVCNEPGHGCTAC